MLIIENLFNDKRYRQHMAELGYALWRRLAPNDVYIPAGEIRATDRVRAFLQTIRG